MKRLNLSNTEKRLLRSIAVGAEYSPDELGLEAVNCAAVELERLGLIKVAWESGHEYVAGKLTDYGKAIC